MDLQKIKALINLASNSKLSELELEEGECRLRIVRGDLPVATTAVEPVVRSAQPAVMPKAAPAQAVIPADSPTVSAEAHLVTAPMFGVFCLTPAPNEPPFVQVGDVVKKGQKLCMLEAMKLFHALEADRDGKVVAILAENGQEVDAGQPLLRIE